MEKAKKIRICVVCDKTFAEDRPGEWSKYGICKKCRKIWVGEIKK